MVIQRQLFTGVILPQRCTAGTTYKTQMHEIPPRLPEPGMPRPSVSDE